MMKTLLSIIMLLVATGAPAQTPNLLGVYDGTSSITLWGCANPKDNQTSVGKGWVDITQQTAGSFSGNAEFSKTVESSSVVEALALSGTVFSGGSLSGSATSQANVDGQSAGVGGANFTGMFLANAIELQFPGGAVGLDDCQHGGARISGSRCGNTTVDDSEECDDGNRADEDGCSSACVSEFCGDGVVQMGLGEGCDDGNTNNEDACDNVCAVPEPDTTLFRFAGVIVLGLLHRRRVATGRISH